MKKKTTSTAPSRKKSLSRSRSAVIKETLPGMKKKSSSISSAPFPELRKKAGKKPKAKAEAPVELTRRGVRSLMHELGKHQIELEVQNEELRSAQAELETACSKYSDLYDFVPVGYLTLDKKGFILEVNLTGAEMLGIKRSSLLKKPFIDCIAKGADRDLFRVHQREVQRTQARQTCEIMLKKRNAHSFPAQLICMPVKTVSGHFRMSVIDVTDRRRAEEAARKVAAEMEKRVEERTRELAETNRSLVRDITACKRTEDALRETQARFQAFFDQSSEGITVADREGRYVMVNPSFCRMTGYSREELLTLSVKDVLSENVEQRLFKRVSTQKISGQREAVLCRKDGSRFHASISATVLRIGEQRFVHGIVRDITARITTEAALRESEKRLRTLIDAIPDAVFFKNAAGNHMIANRACKDIFGFPMEMLIGRTVEDFLPPESAADCRRNDEEVLKNKVTVRAEEYSIGLDGNKHVLDIIKVPLYDDVGNAIGLVGIARDITDRKHAEHSINRLLNHIELILNSAGEGIYGTDLNDNLTFMNHAAAKMIGHDPEELIGRQIHYILHHTKENGSPYAHEQCPVLSVARDGRARHVSDEVFWRKDGTSFPVEYTATPIREQDRVVGTVVVFSDISARRQAETDLRVAVIRATLEKSKTEAIIAALGDAINIQDTDYTVLYQNQIARDLYGDCVGKPCYQAFQDRDRVCDNCHLAMAFADGGIHTSEQRRDTPRGTAYYEITASPVRDASGEIIAGIELVRDITERKRTEESLRLSHDELAIRVQERTAELTMLTGQLRSLTEHLHKVREEERTKIAREIHDDLGQSLTALNMDLSFLQKNMPPGHAVLDEKLNAMATLIGMTMQSIRRISTDLRPGILDVLGLPAALEWQAGEYEKRTGIACAVTCNAPDLELDRDRATTIFRIFQETLSNIARHAEATQVIVTLKRDPESLMLRVKDNGKGIAEQQLSKPRSFGLIGMRERALSWGGEATVRSSRGGGTTVTVRIPLDNTGGTA